MSNASNRTAKRRISAGALALSLLATPSLALVANATTVREERPAADAPVERLKSTSTVPFTTVIVEDPELPADTEVVDQPGVNGLKYVYTVPQYSDSEGPSYREVVQVEAEDRVIRKGTAITVPVAEAAPKPEPVVEAKTETTASRSEEGSASESVTYTEASTSGEYSVSDLMFMGVINWSGYKFTYYSQSVLPGSGLSIPGRHVNGGGFVSDGDGYIVLAAPYGISHGTTFATPFGYTGKVYDTCASCSTSPLWLDVYTQ